MAPVIMVYIVFNSIIFQRMLLMNIHVLSTVIKIKVGHTDKECNFKWA